MLRICAHVLIIFVASILFIKGVAIEADGGNATLGIGMLTAGVLFHIGNFVWMAGSVRRWRL